jgi:alpha(1,3/1,4) fucosyltransferase
MTEAKTYPKKKRISINIARFWAGATFDSVAKFLLPDLKEFYEFEVSDTPKILLYGPYSGALPGGRYIKVFVGCENVRPILGDCDWAFGVQHEDTIKSCKYMRFVGWGDQSHLIHRPNEDWVSVLKSKERFCAFLYSNRVFYREAFFKALSRYKPVDAPGRSMNNVAAIDSGPGNWNSKIEFLKKYKFVIAFENSSFPGYNTEKLSDAIQAHSIPIYWGDPQIGRSFNVGRFINAHDYLREPKIFLPRLPHHPCSTKNTSETLFTRAARRWNGLCSNLEQRRWAFDGFNALIEEIIRIDGDDSLYLERLRLPFLINNELPDQTLWISRWRQIFDGV